MKHKCELIELRRERRGTDVENIPSRRKRADPRGHRVGSRRFSLNGTVFVSAIKTKKKKENPRANILGSFGTERKKKLNAPFSTRPNPRFSLFKHQTAIKNGVWSVLLRFTALWPQNPPLLTSISTKQGRIVGQITWYSPFFSLFVSLKKQCRKI